MDPKRDAYGQEILAFFQGKKAYEVVERDDGFVDFSGGAAMYFTEFAAWPTIQQQAIAQAKGTVLDVGAGAGRVALYLQQKGCDVVAIDNSPLAIRVCKRRGVKRATVLPIEKIGTFKPETFDTIVMFGNNFGLFGNFKKAQRLLKTFHKITSPHALIITENVDPYRTEDPAHLSYHKRNKKRGRMPGQLRLRIRYRQYVGDWFDYLLVSQSEMKQILKGTGWKVKTFIDSEEYMYSAIIEKE